MHKFKGTPGPWVAFHNAGANMQGYSQSSGVAGTNDNRMKIVCGCFKDIGGEQIAAANAQLISCAPELLAALILLVSEPLRYNGNRIEIDCDDHSDAMLIVKTAREAVERATAVEDL